MATAFSVSVNIGGKIAPSLPAAIKGVEAQVGSMAARLGALNARTTQMLAGIGRGATRAGERLQSAGNSFTASVSAPTGLMAFSAARMAFEYEKAGNFLEALGDATVDQRLKFEALANELNKKYPQKLAEIIRTGNEMLKGGFDFSQMLGAIDQTLATAVLGDMTPSEVGNMMARTINSFQMPMKTYEQAMRSAQQVSDRMTYAAVKTTASLRDMGEMYRYVGGAASAAGNDLDTATAFAMAFAKNGSVGSDAGVALRSAIVRMVKMPKGGLAALERIGMSLGDYVGGKQALTSDRIIGGLQASGIDAAPLKAQIDRLLTDKGLVSSPVKLGAQITKLVQEQVTKSGSAVDASAIAENVQESIVAAGSKIDLLRFFTDLKAKMDAGTATLGDVSQILEGRHFSRYQALLQSDLGGILAAIKKEADGYTQSRYGTVLKGIVGPTYEVNAALEALSATLGRLVFPDVAKMLTGISDALNKLSASNPAMLKLGAYAGMAAIALGPLAIAAGATLRVLAPLATGLGLLGAAATTGLAVRLVGIAKGIAAVSLAASAGLVGRLRALGAGIVALGAVGGSSAVLGAAAGSVAAFGAAVLRVLNPLNILRVAVVGLAAVFSPVGIAVTAIVAGLTALGVWVYANREGIMSFLTGIGDGFMKGLGPTTAGYVDRIATELGTAFRWVSDLLGPINATNEAWKSWGETVGGAVAGAVNTVANAISRVIGLFAAAYEKAVAFKNAIMSIGSGGVGGGTLSMPETDAMGNAIPGRWAGGPVSAAKPYIVGEKGPELFVPQQAGRIETNGVYRRLAGQGTAAVAGGGANPTRAEARPSINVGGIHLHGVRGGEDAARMAESAVERVLARYEAETRNSLSD